MNNIEKSMGEVEKRLKVVEAEIREHNNRVASLEKTIVTTETRLKILEDKTTAIERGIDYLKGSLDSLRDNVVNILVAELRKRMEIE